MAAHNSPCDGLKELRDRTDRNVDTLFEQGRETLEKVHTIEVGVAKIDTTVNGLVTQIKELKTTIKKNGNGGLDRKTIVALVGAVVTLSTAIAALVGWIMN